VHFHLCGDEVMAFMAAVPFIGLALARARLFLYRLPEADQGRFPSKVVDSVDDL
jgi:hypothetical protein